MRRNHLLFKTVLIVLLWAFFGATLATALRGEWYTPWRHLNVPTIKPPFFDLRGIPFAVETSRKGFDPYTEKLPPNTPPLNSPWKIEFDYPRVWIPLFAGLGITQDRIPLAALAFIALYLSSLSMLIAGSANLLGSVAVFLAGFSSASLLAVERGNNDLLTFALVFFGAQSPAIFVFLLFLGAATILKLYPLAGLAAGALFRKERVVIAACLCLAIVYFWTQHADIAKIPNNIPAAFGQSYGVQAIAIGLANGIHPHSGATFLGSHLALQFIRIAILILTLAAILFGAWYGLRCARRLSSAQLPPPQPCYLVFSAIFISTFLISPNFEYRLIFLIPTLPFYALLYRNPEMRRLSLLAIALTFCAINGQIFGHFAPWKVTSHIARTLLIPVTAYTLGSIAYSLDLFQIGRREVRHRSEDAAANLS